MQTPTSQPKIVVAVVEVVLAFSDLHSTCEHLQELLRLIYYLIGLFDKL